MRSLLGSPGHATFSSCLVNGAEISLPWRASFALNLNISLKICPLPSFLLMLATTLGISPVVPLKIHLLIHSIKY